VTLGSNVIYIDNADPSAVSTAPSINGDETYELFDNSDVSIDGPTGQAVTVQKATYERIAAQLDGALAGSWTMSANADVNGTPGYGCAGDGTGGFVVSEYADANDYNYEYIELYYDAPTMGGGGESNNQDSLPFATENGWLGEGIPMKAGWNLISLPLIQADEGLTTVLSSIAGKYTEVQWYNGSSGQWEQWSKAKLDTGNDELNSLSELDHTMGIFVNMAAAGMFYPAGEEPLDGNNDVWLQPGWNLVGFPSTVDNTLINTALSGISFDRVETFDADAQAWEVLNPAVDIFTKGKGYWVRCDSAVAQLWDVS